MAQLTHHKQQSTETEANHPPELTIIQDRLDKVNHGVAVMGDGLKRMKSVAEAAQPTTAVIDGQPRFNRAGPRWQIEQASNHPHSLALRQQQTLLEQARAAAFLAGMQNDQQLEKQQLEKAA